MFCMFFEDQCFPFRWSLGWIERFRDEISNIFIISEEIKEELEKESERWEYWVFIFNLIQFVIFWFVKWVKYLKDRYSMFINFKGHNGWLFVNWEE